MFLHVIPQRREKSASPSSGSHPYQEGGIFRFPVPASSTARVPRGPNLGRRSVAAAPPRGERGSLESLRDRGVRVSSRGVPAGPARVGGGPDRYRAGRCDAAAPNEVSESLPNERPAPRRRPLLFSFERFRSVPVPHRASFFSLTRSISRTCCESSARSTRVAARSAREMWYGP